MGVTIEIGLPGQVRADALALPVARAPHGLGGEGGRIIDEKLSGRLSRVGGTLCWLLDESLPLPLTDQARAPVDALGERSGDLVRPFPLHPRYRRYVDSTFADLKNGTGYGVRLIAELAEGYA